MKIYHGSAFVIEKPKLELGKKNNDYGQGFYTTPDVEMAKEWACQKKQDGYANEYELDITELKVMDLESAEYNILNWIAILLANRNFILKSNLSVSAKNYLLEYFLPNVNNYDIVRGYRADDSYFNYANDFINNAISVRELEEAMKLGNLGIQMQLRTEKAFKKLKFIEAIDADKNEYYHKYINRDTKAREGYRKIQGNMPLRDDLYILDIIRQEIKNDDSRIQRNIPR